MSVIDLGPLTIHASQRNVDVYAPYHKGLIQELKKLQGKFDKPAKRWRLHHEPKDADKTFRKLCEGLERLAPNGWKKELSNLHKYQTVTSEFAIVMSIAGLRVEVPEGTRAETVLSRIRGIDRTGRDEGAFIIWPEIAMQDGVADTLAEVQKADWQRFLETTRWMQNREVIGDIKLGHTSPDTYGIDEGATVVAETGFVAEADPAYRIAPVHEYVLKILELRPIDEPGKYELAFRYTPPEEAYPILQKRNTGADRRYPLTLDRVGSRFTTNFSQEMLGDGDFFA